MNLNEWKEQLVKRRAMLIAPFAFAGLVALSSQSEPRGTGAAEVEIAEFDDSGKRLRTSSLKNVVKTDGEWKRQLSQSQYYVTRHGSTDTPFTGTFYQMYEAGLFRCVCCSTALFRSETKFDSGTGWPSFSSAVAEANVRQVKDTSLMMERVEVRCRLCDAHLGHLFDDGPPPTGLRYCMNESALRFVAYRS